MDLKVQQQIFNADFKFIHIITKLNSEITNNWIKIKNDMERKEYQDVFKCWSYNYTFDFTIYRISEDVRNKIKEEGTTSKNTQFEFI